MVRGGVHVTGVTENFSYVGGGPVRGFFQRMHPVKGVTTLDQNLVTFDRTTEPLDGMGGVSNEVIPVHPVGVVGQLL